eukprot:364516-Chlamydomonas_euryale.AAC.4
MLKPSCLQRYPTHACPLWPCAACGAARFARGSSPRIWPPVTCGAARLACLCASPHGGCVEPPGSRLRLRRRRSRPPAPPSPASCPRRPCWRRRHPRARAASRPHCLHCPARLPPLPTAGAACLGAASWRSSPQTPQTPRRQRRWQRPGSPPQPRLRPHPCRRRPATEARQVRLCRVRRRPPLHLRLRPAPQPTLRPWARCPAPRLRAARQPVPPRCSAAAAAAAGEAPRRAR